jgi:hypothetical protein
MLKIEMTSPFVVVVGTLATIYGVIPLLSFTLYVLIPRAHESFNDRSVIMASVRDIIWEKTSLCWTFLESYWFELLLIATGIAVALLVLFSLRKAWYEFKYGYTRVYPKKPTLDSVAEEMTRRIVREELARERASQSGKDVPETILVSPMIPLVKWPPYLVSFEVRGSTVGMGSRVLVPGYHDGLLLTAGHVIDNLRALDDKSDVKIRHQDMSLNLPPDALLVVSTKGTIDIAGLLIPAKMWSMLGVKGISIAPSANIGATVKVAGFMDHRLEQSVGRLTKGPLAFVMKHDASTIPSWSGSPVVTRFNQIVGIHFGARRNLTSNLAHIITDLWRNSVPESDISDRSAWKYEKNVLDQLEIKNSKLLSMRDQMNGYREFMTADDKVEALGNSSKTLRKMVEIYNQLYAEADPLSGDRSRASQRLERYLDSRLGMYGGGAIMKHIVGTLPDDWDPFTRPEDLPDGYLAENERNHNSHVARIARLRQNAKDRDRPFVLWSDMASDDDDFDDMGTYGHGEVNPDFQDAALVQAKESGKRQILKVDPNLYAPTVERDPLKTVRSEVRIHFSPILVEAETQTQPLKSSVLQLLQRGPCDLHMDSVITSTQTTVPNTVLSSTVDIPPSTSPVMVDPMVENVPSKKRKPKSTKQKNGRGRQEEQMLKNAASSSTQPTIDQFPLPQI